MLGDEQHNFSFHNPGLGCCYTMPMVMMDRPVIITKQKQQQQRQFLFWWSALISCAFHSVVACSSGGDNHHHHHHHRHLQWWRSNTGSNSDDYSSLAGPQSRLRDHDDSNMNQHEQHRFLRSGGRQQHHHHIESLSNLSFCGTPLPTTMEEELLTNAFAAWQTQHSQRRLEQLCIPVPVYFTIFQPDNSTGFMSEADVNNTFIKRLNQGFAIAPFQFVLQSVQHIVNPYFAAGNGETTYKKLYKQRGPTDMNVYVTDLRSVNLIGYAYLPSILAPPFSDWSILDGVVMMNPALAPSVENYVLITNVFVHEVGHWCGLLHTFQVRCMFICFSVVLVLAHSSPFDLFTRYSTFQNDRVDAILL